MNPNNEDKKPNSRSIKLVFDNNASFTFFYKKTEKITTAVYMVSAFIKDEDHIKWQLRRKSLDLLSLALSLSHAELLDKKDGQKVAAVLIELVSLFEIAVADKIISEMNFSILKQEFLALLSMLEEEMFPESSRSLILSDDFFNIEKMISSQGEGSHKGHSGDSKGHEQMRHIPVQISKVFNKGLPQSTATKNSPKNTASDRKTIILDLFKTKKEIGITDLANLIKDCSEKTIQRELLGMVKDGVLKKQGERRWSRYVRA